jgi:WD40 repeat protein
VDWVGRHATFFREEAEHGATCPANNFLKGVKWSPDGSCLLANSEDHRLRLYELTTHGIAATWRPPSTLSGPALRLALRYPEPECIYDFAWYPGMRATEPSTSCFLSSCRDTPIHLWDGWTGKLRATYRAFDAMDEITAALAVAFSPDGQKIYSGFENNVRIFDTGRPGRDCIERKTTPTRGSREGQHGLLSCIAVDGSGSGLYAVGSYGGTVGVYRSVLVEPQGASLR